MECSGRSRVAAGGLNPLASVFVPKACSHATVRASTAGTDPQGDARGFGQLPDEVLAAVLSCLEQPKDVLACAMASRHLQEVAAYAPLRLHIHEVEGAPRPKFSQGVSLVQQTLHGVSRHFKGVHMLDLSNTLVDDHDISKAVEECQELRVLKLAGCRKLTSVSEALLAPDAGVRLEFLSLQRCFQTKDDALAELLEAAATTKQSLRCIALSHLQLQQWPLVAPELSAQTAKDAQGYLLSSHVLQVSVGQLTRPSPVKPRLAGSSLQALALHNCHGITPAGLQALASACPHLQLLFLGGSTIQVPKQSNSSSSLGPGQLPMLNSIPRSRAATIAGMLRKVPSSYHPSARPVAAELAALVLQLPHLLVLEVTFLPHGTQLELGALLADRCSNRCVHIWDLCQSKSIAAAVKYGSSVGRNCNVGDGTDLSSGRLQAHLMQLVEAAVNCSNAARQTPLHVAVDVNDANAVEVTSLHALRVDRQTDEVLWTCKLLNTPGVRTTVAQQALLQLGSGVNARDKGAATPLFVACESGHATCAELLLHGGADVVLRNSAGEAPLYIAALRGELMVVDVLLHHMHQEGVRWQDGQLYGDGWTPLMAAAVADRHNIAVRLLSAAGSAVGALVRHANRYGQTAVHIAARKGSLPLLTALLTIGGPAVAAARDCVGVSPADIASKNNHTAALELLCSVGADACTPRRYVRSHGYW